MLPQTHHQVHCALHTVHRRDGVPGIIIIIITIIIILITIIIIIIIIITTMSYLLLMSVAPHMAQPWVEQDWR